MNAHYRYRRSLYPQPERSNNKLVGRVIVLVIALGVLYFLGKGLLAVFGMFTGGSEHAVTLRVEQNANVDVAYDSDSFQVAEDGSDLQAGDAVRTTADAHASLLFFDGTRVRLDEQTSVTILETDEASKGARIRLELLEGSLWISTPVSVTDTANTRIIQTARLEFAISDDAEVVVSPRSAIAYKTNSDGIVVTAKDTDATTTIGEGQQLLLPSDTASLADVDTYKTAFTLATFRNPFALESRTLLAGGSPTTDELDTQTGPLVVLSPGDNAIVTESSVRVSGRIDDTVQTVRINGQETIVNETDGSFVEDFALMGNESVDIHVEALGADGTIVAEVTRTVQRNAEQTSSSPTLIASPAITEPVKTGETYQTTAEEVVIRGTAPTGTTKIMVNDYALRLFDPAKGTWSYLARLDLSNMKPGSNTYDVVAENANGDRSAAARITINHGTATSGASSASSAASAVPPQNNAPLTPGVVKVIAPAAGTEYTATGTGFLLEGNTSTGTESIWVNDYRLQLYVAGKTYWNYIASPDLGNLKEGRNIFTIIARNKEGRVLDMLDYVVTYNP